MTRSSAPPSRTKRGHVGDGVADAVPVAVPLEVHRLVEVHRAGRVDGEERQRRLVALRQVRRRGRDLLGLGERVGGVVEREAELGAHRGEPVAQRLQHLPRDVGVGRGQAHAGVRHAAQPNLRRLPPC